MDPHARLRQTLEGVACSVCGAGIDPAGVRLLAEREDLAFVELSCTGCRSASIGIVTFSDDDPGALGTLDIPGGSAARVAGDDFSAADIERLSGVAPVGLSDVLAMRELLAGHRGDLRSLLEDEPGPTASASG
jgi:hypothetical protein